MISIHSQTNISLEHICVECIDLIWRGIEFHTVGVLHEKT